MEVSSLHVLTAAVSEVEVDRDLSQLIICNEEPELAYASDGTRVLRLLDLRTGKDVQVFQLVSPANQMSDSCDGMILLVTHAKGMTALFEYSLDLMKEFRMEGGALAAAIHPGKESVMTSHSDNSIRLTHFDTEHLIRTHPSPTGSRTLGYSPDGEVLGVARGRELFLWPHRPGRRYGLWMGQDSILKHTN